MIKRIFHLPEYIILIFLIPIIVWAYFYYGIDEPHEKIADKIIDSTFGSVKRAELVSGIFSAIVWVFLITLIIKTWL